MRIFHSKLGVSLLVAISFLVFANAFAQTCYVGGTTADGSFVNVIDVANVTVANQIQVPKAPGGIAFNSDASMAYVAMFGSFDGFGNEVVAIDTDAQAVAATYTNVCGSEFAAQGPSAVSISPDDRYVFASCLGDIRLVPGRTVARIDTTDGSINRIQLGSTAFDGRGPFGSDITPTGNKLYVSEFGSALGPKNTVAVIDPTSGNILRRITVQNAPALVKMCSDGSFAYVGNNVSGTISKINTQTDTVLQNITFPFSNAGPAGITMLSDCSRAFVAHYGTFLNQNNKFSVINTADGSVTNTFTLPPTGNGPFGVAVTPDDAYLVVSILGPVLPAPTDTRVYILDISDPDNPAIVDGSPLNVGVGPTGVACTF